MPSAKTTTKKKPTRKKATKKASKKAARKRSTRTQLTPRKEKRGLAGDEVLLAVDHPDVRALADEVREHGGAAIGAYREPFSGRPILLASLPLAAVAPTPFQRDLSPTHVKRLAQKIEEAGSFLDPLIVVRGPQGELWTPNGRHRLAAAKTLGLRQVTALVSPDEDLSFRILALNTEKAHNLKDRSLEVIRMAQELARRHPRHKESDHAAEFEGAELLTLGLVYQENGRFAGGAYRPLLRKVDRFSSKTLGASLRLRKGWASRLLTIDALVKEHVEALTERGHKSPYLRPLVVARLNPVRWHRAKRGDDTPPMTLPAALTKMAAAARAFDPDSVRPGDLALAAAFGAGDE